MSDKRNADIKRLEDYLKNLTELKVNLENQVKGMKILHDELAETYPELDPFPNIEDFEPYIIANQAIAILTKVIEKRKNDNK